MIAPYDPKRDSEPRATPRSIDPEERDPAGCLPIIFALFVFELAVVGALLWFFWR